MQPINLFENLPTANLVTCIIFASFKILRKIRCYNAALDIVEHRGHTRVISSIASWKEGFTESIHMYKKHGRHDTDAESVNNDEEQFATLFFNFMRKHIDIVISQVSVP
jgi:hypothetical protein